MERWLAQRLSDVLGTGPGGGDGSARTSSCPRPRRLAGDAGVTASGIAAEEGPVAARAVGVSLLDVLDGCVHEPWLHALAGHLGRTPQDGDDDPRRSRRFAVVRHLADLFDRYALAPPGDGPRMDAGRDEHGSGMALRDDQRWQAELTQPPPTAGAGPAPPPTPEP